MELITPRTRRSESSVAIQASLRLRVWSRRFRLQFSVFVRKVARSHHLSRKIWHTSGRILGDPCPLHFARDLVGYFGGKVSKLVRLDLCSLLA